MSGLRRTPFHRVLHRPNLVLGSERELALFAALLTGGLAFSALNLVAGAVGLGVWCGGIALLRMMAKADPHMSRVYVRHIRYRAYYPARARPFL